MERNLRKTRTGKVVSDKMDKTIVVAVEDLSLIHILDGMTRDRDGNIDDLDNFPVYSRGFMPRGSVKTDQGAINTPIMCGGVWVNPGDLVVGDSDGVVVIPREYIEIVLAKAEEKEFYEKKRRQQIAAYRKAVKENAPLPELAPGWVLDMLNK